MGRRRRPAALVERAGGQVIEDPAHGIDIGARLAFIAHDNPEACSADAARARGGVAGQRGGSPGAVRFYHAFAGRSQPGLAVGTAGASAGLAKHVRLRLERALPQGLGALADALMPRARPCARAFPMAQTGAARSIPLGEGGARSDGGA
jgi:uroporphyrin-III C-methyltransferase/precorrin-2 dehydrogenase/sirohydrochlorin ferrochelatase